MCIYVNTDAHLYDHYISSPTPDSYPLPGTSAPAPVGLWSRRLSTVDFSSPHSGAYSRSP